MCIGVYIYTYINTYAHTHTYIYIHTLNTLDSGHLVACGASSSTHNLAQVTKRPHHSDDGHLLHLDGEVAGPSEWRVGHESHESVLLGSE